MIHGPDSKYAIYFYQGSDTPMEGSDGRPRGNQFFDNTIVSDDEVVKMVNSDDNVFEVCCAACVCVCAMCVSHVCVCFAACLRVCLCVCVRCLLSVCVLSACFFCVTPRLHVLQPASVPSRVFFFASTPRLNVLQLPPPPSLPSPQGNVIHGRFSRFKDSFNTLWRDNFVVDDMHQAKMEAGSCLDPASDHPEPDYYEHEEGEGEVEYNLSYSFDYGTGFFCDGGGSGSSRRV